MPTIETTVLAVLRPGGLLTADQIARSANTPKWRTQRALQSLCRAGKCFRNRNNQWQVSPRDRRPSRQAAR